MDALVHAEKVSLQRLPSCISLRICEVRHASPSAQADSTPAGCRVDRSWQVEELECRHAASETASDSGVNEKTCHRRRSQERQKPTPKPPQKVGFRVCWLVLSREHHGLGDAHARAE